MSWLCYYEIADDRVREELAYVDLMVWAILHGDIPPNYKIPESLRAFCRIVSLTAANTRRIFDVSVACVKLQWLEGRLTNKEDRVLLRIEVQVCSIDLIESPQQVLCCSIDIVSARIIREVVSQWRSSELLLEQIDFV
jgi:hypothetical protein